MKNNMGPNTSPITLGRKSQITLFIIMGIVLLIGLGLYIAIQTETLPLRQPASADTITTVPIAFQPVYAYVDYCLTTTTINGLKLLGEHGGYISL